MASKFSAARPKRAGEVFARLHHGEERGDGDGGSATIKKVKFDVRNPSALAPDARDDDEILDADVIGVGMAATKRGAVNIDGYDSDSDNEAFDGRAEQRIKITGKEGGGGGNVDLLDQLDNYSKRLSEEKREDGGNGKDDDDDDMFADTDDKDETSKDGPMTENGKEDKTKEVRFLDDSKIEGQELTSQSRVRLDDDTSSDEEDAELAIREEDIDEEVGPGGLKKHAPKIDAFNMKQEQEEGAFDEAGNFIRKGADPDAQHDRWLEGVSQKQIKRAAAAHEKRAAELRQQRQEEDSLITRDLLKILIRRLERGETALEALARLGKVVAKERSKRIPAWKQKKQNRSGRNGGDTEEQMDVDKTKAPQDPDIVSIKADIDAITEAADHLLNREYTDIYHTERELLMREYRSETGEAWVDSPRQDDDSDKDSDAGGDGKEQPGSASSMWEFRWVDRRDGGAKQGPFDGKMMKAWQDAGYFGDGVEFRLAGENGNWSREALFS